MVYIVQDDLTRQVCLANYFLDHFGFGLRSNGFDDLIGTNIILYKNRITTFVMEGKNKKAFFLAVDALRYLFTAIQSRSRRRIEVYFIQDDDWLFQNLSNYKEIVLFMRYRPSFKLTEEENLQAIQDRVRYFCKK